MDWNRVNDINNLDLCSDCIIDAGSVVTKDKNKSGTYLGILMKKVKE